MNYESNLTDEHLIEFSSVCDGADSLCVRYVVGFSGIYAVSTRGDIVSFKRKAKTAQGERTVSTRKLKPLSLSGKCPIMNLHRDGDIHSSSIARLMLEAFVRSPLPNEVATTKDGNQRNLTIDNLKWSTFSEISIEKNSGYYGVNGKKIGT
jgi:hypothetical protein